MMPSVLFLGYNFKLFAHLSLLSYSKFKREHADMANRDKDKPREEERNREPEPQFPERPLECCECRKNISVVYTEIIGQAITRTSMCAECPELRRRLHGVPAHIPGTAADKAAAGLACGNCGTTLEALRVGLPVGCSECYEVFNDVLLTELIAAGNIPERISSTKKSTPVHIGRAPGQAQEMNPSLRLLALNEALTETLKREDYEQAALLRDQIKALTDKSEDGNEKQ